MSKRKTTEEFITEAKQIHGDKYDYSKVVYKDSVTKVCIICPIHGMFWQRAIDHTKGKGCPECGKKSKTINTSEFIKKAKQVHGDAYDYTQTEYINTTTKIRIICPEHGSFWQSPNKHLAGQGCPKCYDERRGKNKLLSNDDFIKRAKEIHGNKYNYNKTAYSKIDKKVVITCSEHGDFLQTPMVHLKGCGCPKCRGWYLTNDEFIKKARQVHGDKYDYSKINYVNSNTKIEIICPEHGSFWQMPNCHLDGQGCPFCGHMISNSEKDVANFIKSIIGSDEVLTNNRSILNNKQELDIYVPLKKIAIEYNGLLWHSEKYKNNKYYHLNKTLECQKLGIKLIHIFEDEWIEHPEIVKDKLKSYLGVNNSTIIGARKCSVKEVDKKTAEVFLNKNHIQGFTSSTIYLGAFYGCNLIGIMSFKKESKNTSNWELNRFATDNNFKFPGLANKMFKYFREHHTFREVKSFLDLRWNWTGNTVYEKMGFTLDKIEKPDYFYIYKNKRYHKFGFRKQTLHRKYGLPLSMTEKEMCDKLGFYRIWNCGLAKYIYKNKSIQ